MISSVLVVCVGNICRSPVGERLLAAACPDLRIESAGIHALVGHGASEDSAAVAAQNGISVAGHVARQFTNELAANFDLILVLEKRHMNVVCAQDPSLSGKTMLFGHWMGRTDIVDPNGKSHDFHVSIFNQLREASEGWAQKLGDN